MTADGHRGTAAGDRRRVTRALTTAQLQHEWNASRSESNAVVTPARTITPPLYLELSSSDDDEDVDEVQPPPAADVISDRRTRTTAKNVRRRYRKRKRKRRRHDSVPSRSLELSFSSIEKDDVSGAGDEYAGAYYSTSTSGRGAGTKMTSTPSFDRSMMSSRKESSLRSRWINVEHPRVTETTTTTLRDPIDRRPAARPTSKATSRTSAVSGLRPGPAWSNATRTSRQSPVPASSATHAAQNGAASPRAPPAAVVTQRRKRRRRGRSDDDDDDDPDWRRYPAVTKASSRRSSQQPSHGTAAVVGPCTSPPSSSDFHHDAEPELDVLVELQRRLASTSDADVLRQVVDIIEASGRYQVEDATFDFDLCSLDPATIDKLRRCLGV